jgi:uncharacterized membrane protein YqjE
MAHQTQINGRTTSRSAGKAVRRNVAGLIEDVVELAELQVQLVSVDVREATSQATRPILAVLAGVSLALGAIPVLLLSIGWMLVHRAGLPEDAAFALTSVAGFLIAGALAWLGWRNLNSTLTVLSRSKSELTENIRWIKDALTNRDAAP